MGARIILADDHKLFREGLRALLDNHSTVEIVGEASNGREVLKLARELSPNIIIMDLSMPELNGVETARKLVTKDPNIKIIALSVHSDRLFVNSALEVGVKGYILKENAFEQLAQAIKTVLSGETYFCPKVASIVREGYLVSLKDVKSRTSILTLREREVVQLIAEGRSTKRIAFDLKVSAKTIETHRQHVMKKLNIHSVAELTKYAIREGLTSI